VIRRENRRSKVELIRLSDSHVYLDADGKWERSELGGAGEPKSTPSAGIWSHRVVQGGALVLAVSEHGTIVVYDRDLKRRGSYQQFRDRGFIAKIDDWVDVSDNRKGLLVSVLDGAKKSELDAAVALGRFEREGAFKLLTRPEQNPAASFHAGQAPTSAP
jgi:hypothetical protein